MPQIIGQYIEVISISIRTLELIHKVECIVHDFKCVVVFRPCIKNQIALISLVFCRQCWEEFLYSWNHKDYVQWERHAHLLSLMKIRCIFNHVHIFVQRIQWKSIAAFLSCPSLVSLVFFLSFDTWDIHRIHGTRDMLWNLAAWMLRNILYVALLWSCKCPQALMAGNCLIQLAMTCPNLQL